MLNTFIQTLLAFASAAAGAFLATAIDVSHRRLCAMISFAAGTLFGITFFHIIPEAYEIVPLPAIGLALASGYLLFYLISRYVFHVCPACAASHFDEQVTSNFKSIAILLGIALTIHSLMDGVAIAVSPESAGKSAHLIFMSVAIHKFPEGLALCALFLAAGYDKKKALLNSILFESSTLLGWVLGEIVVKTLEVGPWPHLLLIHIGGGFIYLALHAIINEGKEHSPRFVIMFFLLGTALTVLMP